MKISRSELKSIVKECIMEILAEGLGGDVEALAEAPRASRRQQPRPQKRKSIRERVGGPGFNSNPSLDEPAVNPVAAAAVSMVADPSDPMSKIFADTMATTLQEQRAHGHSGPSRSGEAAPPPPADAAAAIVAQHSPSEMFPEASSKWADMAFAAPADPTKIIGTMR